MSNISDVPETVAKSCSESLNMPLAPIYECVRNKRGNDLLHQMGILTLGLNPQLNYVPWINVDDNHTNENQNQAEKGDLVQLICNNYKGCGRPSVCNNQDDISCNNGFKIKFNHFLIIFSILLYFFF
jgi:interferon gamma-inducible protein 30